MSKFIDINISVSDLRLIDEALSTQIRLLDSYINKSREDEFRILTFQTVQNNIKDILLTD